MEILESPNKLLVNILRWIARILGLFLVILTVCFVIMEILIGHNPDAGAPIVSNVLLGACILGGLLISWRWEMPGAVISLIGFLGTMAFNPGALTLPGLYVFTVPPVIFLVTGLIHWYQKVTGKSTEKKG